MPVELICIDADDTLWHNMRHFDAAERAFVSILQPFTDAGVALERLQSIGARNLTLYGYGAKSFTLSMIETAADLCGDGLPASALRQILEAGRQLHSHPVELLPGVEEALQALADRAQLVLVTKGDLLHQEAKLAASGLGERFSGIEIVSDKHAGTFERLFVEHNVAAARCVMVGDSIRSDILPALEAGAWAAFVPAEIVWHHERADAPVDHARFKQLASLLDVPDWIDGIE
jgi:putative hydrolase of the HAD superfamily